MLHTELILALLLLTPLLLLSGLVSGSETALFGISHAGRIRLAHTSPHTARAVDALLKYPRHLLTALLALNNLINVTYFAVSSILVLGLKDAGATASAAALGIGSVIAIILVGEIAAKLLASAQTVAFCRAVATPWILTVRVGWPLWNALDRYVLRPLVRLASTKPAPTERPSADDLAAVLAAKDAAELDAPATDQRLLAQIINLRERRVRHAMRPRVETPTFPLNAPHERIEAAFGDADSVLITDADEQVIGWLEAIPFHATGCPTDPIKREALLTKPLFIPELASLDAALKQLQTHGKDRAAVVDERGELEGIIQIEDIVATLIEHAGDQPIDTEGHPQLVALGVFSIPGRWPARALLEDLDFNQTHAHAQIDQLLSRVSTVGGLTLALLGRVPSEGDTLELPGASLTVTETQGRVVSRVEVRFHNIANADPATNPEQPGGTP